MLTMPTARTLWPKVPALSWPVPNSDSHLGSGEDRDAAVHVEFEAAVGIHVVLELMMASWSCCGIRVLTKTMQF
jgi:hypothetical protein